MRSSLGTAEGVQPNADDRPEESAEGEVPYWSGFESPEAYFDHIGRVCEAASGRPAGRGEAEAG